MIDNLILYVWSKNRKGASHQMIKLVGNQGAPHCGDMEWHAFLSPRQGACVQVRPPKPF